MCSPRNAVGGGDQVAGVEERGATHVNIVPGVAPEDRGVPRVLAELRVTLLKPVGLDAAQRTHGVTLPAACVDGSLLPGRASATHTPEAATIGDFVAELLMGDEPRF